MAGRRRRKGRRKRNAGKRILICALVEILVLSVLGIAVGWERGISSWVDDLTGAFQRPAVEDLDLSGIKSSNAILIDERTGKTIGSLEGTEAIYPASMTKVMTAIVAIEELSGLEKEITLTEETFTALYQQDATQAGFQAGETVRAIDLLYGALLPSGAECCIALAEDIAGSEEAFVERMNRKAERLGMDTTHFCNTTGLHDVDHYSSARDMAVLMRYALHNSTFREIVQAPWHATAATNIHPDGITYYSTLFRNLSDASVTGGEILGGKTGYTGEAGHCLVSFAQIEDREYILVTAGAPADAAGIPHIQDAVTIYNRLGAAVQAAG